jgi:hypothetical protein
MHAASEAELPAKLSGAFAKLRKATINFVSVCLSLRLQGTTRLPHDGFVIKFDI